MKKYNLIQSANITKGQKITIVSTNSFGFLYTYKTTFISAEPKQHYMNCPQNQIGVLIIHKPKGKRNAIKTNISYNSFLAVYDGWIDIDLQSILFNTYEENGLTIQESKYTCFDNRYYEDLKRLYPNSLISDIA